MRNAIAAVALLFAASSLAADPVYLDLLMERSLSTLQQQFPNLRKEGCYRIGAEQYLLIDIDRKAQKPWRVVVTSLQPCRRPEDADTMDVRERREISLGQRTTEVLEKLGRPDAAAPPEPSLRRLGETEYFFICRVSEGCARHTSVFSRDGIVTAIAEWYSQ